MKVENTSSEVVKKSASQHCTFVELLLTNTRSLHSRMPTFENGPLVPFTEKHGLHEIFHDDNN